MKKLLFLAMLIYLLVAATALGWVQYYRRIKSNAVEIQVHPLNAREIAVSCRSGVAPRVKQTNATGTMLLRCDP